jgi:hypothetical protein
MFSTWRSLGRAWLVIGTLGFVACGADGARVLVTPTDTSGGTDAGLVASADGAPQSTDVIADAAVATDTDAAVVQGDTASNLGDGAATDASSTIAETDSGASPTNDVQGGGGASDSEAGDGLLGDSAPGTDNGQALLKDSDGDGLPDAVEDKNGNGQVDAGETNPAKADTDGDDLGDGAELWVDGTNPAAADTDGDGLSDGLETGKSGDADPGSVTDPKSPDSDGDGIPDGKEDANHNGKVDDDESNPNDAGSTQPPCAGKPDATPCAVGKACLAGACALYKTPTGCASVSCDDGNPCTQDSCSDGNCSHTAQSGACPGGQCQAGKCAPDVCAPGKGWLYVPAGKAWMPQVRLDYVTIKNGDSYASALPPNAEGWQVYKYFDDATATGEAALPGETCKPPAGGSTCAAFLVAGGA